MARYKVEIEEKFFFFKSTRWNNGNIRNIVFINLFQGLSKGNFDNLGNLDLTAFFKLRTIKTTVTVVTIGTLTSDWILPK